jgi:hypothetical protein
MNSNLAAIASQLFFILVLFCSAQVLKEKFKTKMKFENDFDYLYLFPGFVTVLFMGSYLMQETLADQLLVYKGWFAFVTIVCIPLVLLFFISFAKTAMNYAELLINKDRKEKEKELVYENKD